MTSPQLYTPAIPTPLSKGRKLAILVLSFIVMMALTVILSTVVAMLLPSPRAQILWTTGLQNVVGFIGAALVTARFLAYKPLRWLGVDTWPGIVPFALALLLIPAMIPAMNALVAWNDSITFSGPLYDMLRELEDSAAEVTKSFMDVSSVGGMLLNVLLIGVLTGIGEEVLFRGALQRTLSSVGLGEHLAVWVSAFVFSFIHFQFFGFVPRLLLGVIFGYVYIWSGSIWVSATLHALNNSIVVVTGWMSAHGTDLTLLENLGTGDCFAWTAPLSLVVTILILWLYRKSIVRR